MGEYHFATLAGRRRLTYLDYDSHRANTPVIAGAVSGGCVGAAWIIGFIIYFYKRHRREKRARAAGFRSHREMLDPPKKKETFVIPPDPAIVEAGHQPGEKIYDDPKVQSADHLKHARTVPIAQAEYASSSKVDGTSSPIVPEMQHTASAPSRVHHTSQLSLPPSTSTPTSGE